MKRRAAHWNGTLFMLFRQERLDGAFENLRLRDTLGSALGFECRCHFLRHAQADAVIYLLIVAPFDVGRGVCLALLLFRFAHVQNPP